MPIYEYECLACNHHLEVLQKMSDTPLTECPQCKGKLEKIFSQSAIQFKGSGWYVSDYGKSGKTDKSSKTDKTDKTDNTDKADKTEKKDPPATTNASTV